MLIKSYYHINQINPMNIYYEKNIKSHIQKQIFIIQSPTPRIKRIIPTSEGRLIAKRRHFDTQSNSKARLSTVASRWRKAPPTARPPPGSRAGKTPERDKRNWQFSGRFGSGHSGLVRGYPHPETPAQRGRSSRPPREGAGGVPPHGLVSRRCVPVPTRCTATLLRIPLTGRSSSGL